MSYIGAPVLCRRPAMNTWFEILLHGDDTENLSAAGEAALDEIERIEQLLSRFDPATEVSRINREAAISPVLLDVELTSIIATCAQAWCDTDGYFDITAGSTGAPGFQEIEFDEQARTIAFHTNTVRLDFGGFGKGYALDRAAHLLREAGITQALLHGGTSSVLAVGQDAGGQPWRVDLRNPWSPGAILDTVFLRDEALSTSATGPDIPLLNPASPTTSSTAFSPSPQPSPAGRGRTPVAPPTNVDQATFNRYSGNPLSQRERVRVRENAFVNSRGQATCTVVAATAGQTEILSTALLCMGQEKAARHRAAGVRVLWANEPEQKSTLL